MLKLAITGGVAEGKSTVVEYLSGMGYFTASSDAMAREVLFEPDVQERLVEMMGGSGPVGPELLRSKIWSDERLRRQVNAIMHPRIVEAIRSSSAEVVEVPLLIEACLQGLFKKVWVVTCGAAEQRSRLIARLGSAPKADDLLASQLPPR
jgi:dephospho-CoA kinase